MPAKYKPWHINENHWGIEIVEGEYKDTVISINSFEFNDKTKNEMTLDYNYVGMTKGKTEDDYKSEQFSLTLNEILNDILLKAITDYENERNNSATTT